ncbi:hypothetical protein LBMAG09_02980 [Actinomycetes bacterium]|nr:hypothetical protein LBMAG09_02980 [Actinomycetes bacterium]
MSKEPAALLKEYLAKINKGEKSAQEVLSAVGGWMKESGDSLKHKIEIEVEAAVKRMGFAKKSDVDELAEEVAELRKLLKVKKEAPKDIKKSTKKAAKGKSK